MTAPSGRAKPPAGNHPVNRGASPRCAPVESAASFAPACSQDRAERDPTGSGKVPCRGGARSATLEWSASSSDFGGPRFDPGGWGRSPQLGAQRAPSPPEPQRPPGLMPGRRRDAGRGVAANRPLRSPCSQWPAGDPRSRDQFRLRHEVVSLDSSRSSCGRIAWTAAHASVDANGVGGAIKPASSVVQHCGCRSVTDLLLALPALTSTSDIHVRAATCSPSQSSVPPRPPRSVHRQPG